MRTIAALILASPIAVASCATDGPEPEPHSGVDVTELSCAPVPDACTGQGPATIEQFASTHDVEARLVGAWRFCGGLEDNGAFGAGLELTPGHRAHVLGVGPDGRCRREPGGMDWYTLDISEQNPDGTYQLVLDQDSSTISLVPTFSTAPVALVDGFAGFRFGRLVPPQ